MAPTWAVPSLFTVAVSLQTPPDVFSLQLCFLLWTDSFRRAQLRNILFRVLIFFLKLSLPKFSGCLFLPRSILNGPGCLHLFCVFCITIHCSLNKKVIPLKHLKRIVLYPRCFKYPSKESTSEI